MYCTECGNKLPDDVKICPYCSYPVITEDHMNQTISQPNQPNPPIYRGSGSSSTNVKGIVGAVVGSIFLIIGIILIIAGFNFLKISSNIGITMMIIGGIILLVLLVTACSLSSAGPMDCSGCDCGGCDCGDCSC